jgi:hypothetical protein
MNTFEFNNYAEFAIFFKINWLDLKDLTEDEVKKTKAEEFLKFFQASKGGCGCNIEKRREATKASYLTFVPLFFAENESAKALVKNALGGLDKPVGFKKDEKDEEYFLLI